MNNIDNKTVSSFSDEWKRFDQESLKGKEHEYLFDKYFGIFPWNFLSIVVGCTVITLESKGDEKDEKDWFLKLSSP